MSKRAHQSGRVTTPAVAMNSRACARTCVNVAQALPWRERRAVRTVVCVCVCVCAVCLRYERARVCATLARGHQSGSVCAVRGTLDVVKRTVVIMCELLPCRMLCGL